MIATWTCEVSNPPHMSPELTCLSLPFFPRKLSSRVYNALAFPGR